jgi:flagellar basal body P-ring protein FlgI
MLLLCGVMVTSGCSSWRPWAVRSQSPEGSGQDASNPRLVGDLASPFNVHPITIEYVGLVTKLKGTGSDPRPSPERSVLIGEMQTRGIRNPNAMLASGDTALVKVRAALRPGIQKDDRFDVEVRVLSQDESTSLRGGYLLQTELKEMAVLSDSRFHSGHTFGVAEGPVLVADPSADPKKDRVLTTRGLVLGGGIAR